MLVILHGFTELDLTWREGLGPEFGARCELLPGHGFNPCAPDLTIDRYVDTLVATFPAEPIDLLGYSMGGRLALSLALRHPGRLRRLILVSSSPGIADNTERAARALKDEHLAQVLEEDGLGPFVSLWESSPAIRPAKPLPLRVEEALRSQRFSHDPLGLAAAMRCLGLGAMSSRWAELPTLRLPTLLIAGDHDTKYVKVLGDMASRIPCAKVAVVADCGHAIHREQSYALKMLVRDFLA